jgi:predicted O-methyltransferase YrrM
MKSLIRELQDLDSIVSATTDYCGYDSYKHIYATQRVGEITELAKVVQKIQPKIIVEIGTWTGGTLFIWVRTNINLEMAVSIDLPGGGFGGGYDKKRIKLYKQFAADRPNTRMEFIRADSHATATLTTLKQLLGRESIDFLYIDGDHTYDGVKKDFEMYAPLVRKGGIVAFHDIVTKGNDHKVWLYWNEIKTNYEFEEIIEDPQGDMGLGIIHM